MKRASSERGDGLRFASPILRVLGLYPQDWAGTRLDDPDQFGEG